MLVQISRSDMDRELCHFSAISADILHLDWNINLDQFINKAICSVLETWSYGHSQSLAKKDQCVCNPFNNISVVNSSCFPFQSSSDARYLQFMNSVHKGYNSIMVASKYFNQNDHVPVPVRSQLFLFIV